MYKNHFRILGPSISNVVQGGKIQFPANIGWHRFPVTVFQYSELPIRKIIIGHRKPRKGNFKMTSPPRNVRQPGGAVLTMNKFLRWIRLLPHLEQGALIFWCVPATLSWIYISAWSTDLSTDFWLGLK